MKTVQQIYTDYKIMPALQLHQLRVAAVGKMIAENFDGLLDKESIIYACLFHDMGNIIKSDLDYFPEFVKPEGKEYWQAVKDEYIKKYGSDEHVATEMIAQEINLPPRVFRNIGQVGFSRATENEASGSFEYKICNYADMRISPYGTLPMLERIADAKKRYEGKNYPIAGGNFESLVQSLKNTEQQIFSKTRIAPEEITNGKINDSIESLRSLTI